MIISDCIKEVTALGFGGMAIWRIGDEYMGCLLGGPPDFAHLHDTNCWHYLDSPEAVATNLSATARLIRKREAQP